MKMVNVSAFKAFIYGLACGAAAWSMWQDIHKAICDKRIIEKTEANHGA